MTLPIPHNEAQRLAALLDLQVLDTPTQKLYDDITELASNICDVPMALISLIDADRQWFKSRHGVNLIETPRSESICAHTIMDPQRVFVVSNAHQDPRFSELPLVTSGVIRFYAGAPITTPDGYVLGAVCVLDRRDRELLPQQRRQLQNLADLAMNLIKNDAPSRRRLHTLPESAQKEVWTIKSVLDEGRDMCSFIDPQHRFQYVNPAYETHWARPRASLIGTHVAQLVGQQLYEDVIKAGIDQALAGQEVRLNLAQDYPGVGLRRMEVRLIPARGEDDAVHGVVEQSRDITELSQQADALREHVAALDRRRAARDRFLQAVSHDLKEPVNAINNAAPLLVERLNGKLEPLEERCLGYIALAGTRMARLLEDMRLLGELEAHGLQKRNHVARTLVLQSMERLKDPIAQRQAQLDLNLIGELEVDANAFELGLRCAIEHLLRCAAAKPVHINLSLDFDNSMARLAITDRSDLRPQSFLVHQEGTCLNPKAMGTIRMPLSLAIARHIASLHGGWLQEDKTPEGWPRQTFLLPQGGQP